MNLDAEKKEIIREILRTEDDWVLKAIRKLLDLHITEVSDEHKHILNERIAAYEANPDQVIDWEQLKAELMKDE
ncbi:MAG: addiction module protein [Chitinophagaceae bacterium]